MHEIRFDDAALKQLETLPHETARRIFGKIQETRTDPHRYFRRLKNRPDYRLRVGEYRIFADIEEHAILILDVRHRKNAYRNLS